MILYAWHIINASRTVKCCVGQLRRMIMPKPLDAGFVNIPIILLRLFAGFGPDWPTLSRLTGIDQLRMKNILAKLHNLGAYGQRLHPGPYEGDTLGRRALPTVRRRGWTGGGIAVDSRSHSQE